MKILVFGFRAKYQLFDKFYKNDVRLANSFSFEFHDLTKIHDPLRTIQSGQKEITIHENIRTVREVIDTNTNCIVIFWGWIIHDISEILKCCKNANITTIGNDLAYPGITKGLSWFGSIRYRISTKNKYDYTVVEGLHKSKIYNLCGKKTILLYSSEYIDFINQKVTSKAESTKELLVYIDQNFEYHWDFNVGLLDKKKSFIEYYKTIDAQLFKIAENENLKYVVCLHPTQAVEQAKDLFSFANLSKGEVQEMISRAKYVVGHYSQALSFAHLQNKQIAILDVPKEFSYGVHMQTTRYASELKKTKAPVNDIKKDNFTYIKPDIRRKFIAKYICADSSNTMAKALVKLCIKKTGQKL